MTTKEITETKAKEKMMEFARKFEKHVALKKNEAPFDVKGK